jgi:ABC-type multidrug transport system fused ATPase/permease subunit
MAQACQIGTNLWLEHWTSLSQSETRSPALFLGIYAVITVMYMCLSFAVTYVIMVWAGLRATARLHDGLLNSILSLPMSFFDTTPLGRIVNRFSTDIFATDNTLPWGFMSLLMYGVSVLGTIIVIAASTPIFLVMVPPLAFGFSLVQVYYIRPSRSLKRIDSTSRSPVYQHFTETLVGVSTIRAMGVDERFIRDNETKSSISANAYFTYTMVARWLQIRLETLGAMIVLAAALFAVLDRRFLSPSMVGLALSYALTVTSDITLLIRTFCDLQNQLVSVERVDEYLRKNPEAPQEVNQDDKLPENWPQEGRVEFRNYSTRYRQGLDLVIKNISFEVQPAEKVGIVGRTGAGKSSLTLALFRIVEAANSTWAKASHNGADADTVLSEEEKIVELEKVEVEEDGGSIWIDGVDISTVGLSRLRKNLAIIPQDPILFAGTVRENLDPFEELEDVALWEALERAHLKDHITSLSGGLSFKVSQNGDNFSVGQRSLICLARALLRKTKVLILDEATAAVDVETDELIQKTIRKEFKDRTILTIAHRIKTVMDSDKILVLEKGCVEEFESPKTLVQNKDSLFYNLAQQAGEIKDEDE